jgi:putative hydrolase of the HAD superfamily
LKEELAKYINQWNWQKSVDKLITFWFENESRVDKEILKSVEILRNKAIKCYLCTDNEKYRVQHLLNDLGLKNYFDGIFSSAEFNFSKSQQQFWSKLYDQLGKPHKKEILVLDDDNINVESARKFGFNSMLYSNFEEYEEYIKFLK